MDLSNSLNLLKIKKLNRVDSLSFLFLNTQTWLIFFLKTNFHHVVHLSRTNPLRGNSLVSVPNLLEIFIKNFIHFLNIRLQFELIFKEKDDYWDTPIMELDPTSLDTRETFPLEIQHVSFSWERLVSHLPSCTSVELLLVNSSYLYKNDY